jgi:hypothetical protein
MTPIEKLGQAISDALDEAPAADVLTVITGAFVGLTVEMVRRAGHDVAKPITVDGGKQRDITIHPPKPCAACAGSGRVLWAGEDSSTICPECGGSTPKP